MSDDLTYVVCEFVGGPFDGKRWRVPRSMARGDDRMYVPLGSTRPTVTRPVLDARAWDAEPGFRVGVYRAGSDAYTLLSWDVEVALDDLPPSILPRYYSWEGER